MCQVLGDGFLLTRPVDSSYSGRRLKGLNPELGLCEDRPQVAWEAWWWLRGNPLCKCLGPLFFVFFTAAFRKFVFLSLWRGEIWRDECGGEYLCRDPCHGVFRHAGQRMWVTVPSD